MNTQYKQLTMAIDLHSTRSVIGYMNQAGQYLEQRQVPTTAENLQREGGSHPGRP